MKSMRRVFWEYVVERDAIRRRRAAGRPWPWTKNPLLRDYHWPNVHRRFDTGTQWIVRHVKAAKLKDPLDVLFTVYAYRGLNRLETFEKYGLPTRRTLTRWLRTLDAARARGEALGSDRHMTFYRRYRPAIQRLARMPDLAADVFAQTDGYEAVRLLTKAGLHIGPFQGTQVVADIAELGCASFDRHTPVPLSGGSRIGLHLLEGWVTHRSIKREVERSRQMALGTDSDLHGWGFFIKMRRLSRTEAETKALERLRREQPKGLGMTFIDIEHCLCELARFSGVSEGYKMGHRRKDG